MRISKAVVAFILLAAVATVHAETSSNADAEKQIRAALAAWTEAANRGDYKAASTVWAPDLIGWPPSGPDDTWQSEAEYAKLPAKPPQTTYALTINEVIVDGSLAVVRDTWTQTTKQDAGPAKVETFRSFELWRRQPDHSWKISRWIDGPMLRAAGSK
jgi:ketosteroid isomerase-like protein